MNAPIIVISTDGSIYEVPAGLLEGRAISPGRAEALGASVVALAAKHPELRDLAPEGEVEGQALNVRLIAAVIALGLGASMTYSARAHAEEDTSVDCSKTDDSSRSDPKDPDGDLPTNPTYDRTK